MRILASTARGDNRNLVAGNVAAQGVSQDDITKMKREGVAGHDIIKALVSNSKTFADKTDFSKAKYLKKKVKKCVIGHPAASRSAHMHSPALPLQVHATTPDRSHHPRECV